jgi:SRSO17 transposase
MNQKSSLREDPQFVSAVLTGNNEAWLIGEHRTSGEKRYYLANSPAEMDLRNLAATIKARWSCEQAHQQLKEELGLDISREGPGLASIVTR